MVDIVRRNRILPFPCPRPRTPGPLRGRINVPMPERSATPVSNRVRIERSYAPNASIETHPDRTCIHFHRICGNHHPYMVFHLLGVHHVSQRGEGGRQKSSYLCYTCKSEPRSCARGLYLRSQTSDLGPSRRASDSTSAERTYSERIKFRFEITLTISFKPVHPCLRRTSLDTHLALCERYIRRGDLCIGGPNTRANLRRECCMMNIISS
ncbi:hypothetical protein K438DRAFT_808098 [Mycena galopus ATCC 62051]|nr:hypothetical protein K438DRAFT_808098 [Mycena galopus ATCC 62051]